MHTSRSTTCRRNMLASVADIGGSTVTAADAAPPESPSADAAPPLCATSSTAAQTASETLATVAATSWKF